jgi:1-phosphatidylinositol phosphodiesterase
MSIMEEDSFLPSSPQFSRLVHDAIFSPPSSRDLWYLENRIPTLGEVRGKIVLFSRFGKDGEDWEGGLNGIGIHPPIWPDSRQEGFEWEIENARVRVQDWYAIPSFLSIPEKAKVAVEMLHPKPAPKGKQDLAITFLSAARIPFALPSTVACGFGWSRFMLGVEGVNSRVGTWLLRQLAGGDDVGEKKPQLLRPQGADTQETLIDEDESGTSEKKPDRPTDNNRLRGWVLMDFIRDPCNLGIIPLLIEFNEFKNTRD